MALARGDADSPPQSSAEEAARLSQLVALLNSFCPLQRTRSTRSHGRSGPARKPPVASNYNSRRAPRALAARRSSRGASPTSGRGPGRLGSGSNGSEELYADKRGRRWLRLEAATAGAPRPRRTGLTSGPS